MQYGYNSALRFSEDKDFFAAPVAFERALNGIHELLLLGPEVPAMQHAVDRFERRIRSQDGMSRDTPGGTSTLIESDRSDDD